MTITFAHSLTSKLAPVAVGIDPSTSTGLLASLGPKILVAKTIYFPDLKGIARVDAIAKDVAEVVRGLRLLGHPVTAFVEGYSYQNTWTLATLVEIGTAIRLALHTQGVQWYTVNPRALKKWATGDGKADKKLMAAFARSPRWGFTPVKEKGKKTDDVVDAFFLNRMGLAFLAGDPTITDLSTETAPKIPFHFTKLGSASQN